MIDHMTDLLGEMASETWLIVAVFLSCFVARGGCQQEWPVPYERHASRPPSNPYCKAEYAFCPTGNTDGSIPVMDSDDTVDVIVLKTPVWEFKFGDLLGLFNIFHDAVGFKSHKTGKNYTTEWYELFQLFNCTFPHIINGRTDPLWCNQGAACFYEGIDDTHWTKYGVLKKIGEMTGDQFNKLAAWIHSDNDTGLYYQTFRIRDSTDPVKHKEWFTPYDCANYPMRMFQQMANMGVKFDNYETNYTFFTLISDMPQKLGNDSAIFGPHGNPSLAAEMRSFYTDFQSHQSFLQFLIHFIEAGFDIFEEGRFYYYFNSEYWHVPIKKPFIHITYEPVPLPTTKEPEF